MRDGEGGGGRGGISPRYFLFLLSLFSRSLYKEGKENLKIFKCDMYKNN